MTTRQIGSYRGPATLVRDNERLNVKVSMSAEQEMLAARDQLIPGLIGWSGRVAADVHLGQWLGDGRIELPDGKSANVALTRVDGTQGTLRGSGEPPFDVA